jgi:hypothetical protein
MLNGRVGKQSACQFARLFPIQPFEKETRTRGGAMDPVKAQFVRGAGKLGSDRVGDARAEGNFD